MSKFKLDFEGIDILSKRFEDMGGNLHKLAEEALIETHKYVTPKVEQAMSSSKFNFNRTGKTRKSLRQNPKIEWAGNVVSDGVGFDINNGGLPSIFLMHGTPTITPDKKLYSAIFGSATKKAVQEIQRDVFINALNRR